MFDQEVLPCLQSEIDTGKN